LTDQTSRLTYLRLDAEHLDPKPLPRKDSSLITCKLVYAFIQDGERLLNHVDRLLAEGGTFVVLTPVYRIDEEKTLISVSLEQALNELQQRFSSVIQFDGVGIVNFVCQR
jgi:SAM-dependent methyltransferase